MNAPGLGRPHRGRRVAAWAVVLIPLGYGVWQTLRKAFALFA